MIRRLSILFGLLAVTALGVVGFGGDASATCFGDSDYNPNIPLPRGCPPPPTTVVAPTTVAPTTVAPPTTVATTLPPITAPATTVPAPPPSVPESPPAPPVHKTPKFAG